MASIKQYIYFVEGETEQALVKALTKSQIPPGKVIRHNLWNCRIIKQERKLGGAKKTQLCFIIDTDVTGNWTIFKENIQFLTTKGYRYRIYVQNRNLEDELIYCCNKRSHINLTQSFYQINSINEFKTRFCQDKNINATLLKNQFIIDKLWQRPHEFEQYCNHQQLWLNGCLCTTTSSQ